MPSPVAPTWMLQKCSRGGDNASTGKRYQQYIDEKQVETQDEFVCQRVIFIHTYIYIYIDMHYMYTHRIIVW